MAQPLFLVYEVDTESRTARTVSDSEDRNGFPAVPLGCYFADSAETACALAAQQHGRPGVFAAVATTVKDLEFKAGELGDDKFKKITKPPAKDKSKG